MFDHCSNFTVSGGAFDSYAESRLVRPSYTFGGLPEISQYSPHDFRLIRLGDLDLQAEIGAEEIVEFRDVRRRRTGALIRRQRVVVGTRRVCRARVLGSAGVLTAAIYEGTDLERVSCFDYPH